MRLGLIKSCGRDLFGCPRQVLVENCCFKSLDAIEWWKLIKRRMTLNTTVTVSLRTKKDLDYSLHFKRPKSIIVIHPTDVASLSIEYLPTWPIWIHSEEPHSLRWNKKFSCIINPIPWECLNCNNCWVKMHKVQSSNFQFQKI